MQALRCLALHIGDAGAEATPLPAGCCPGNLAEVLEFLQVICSAAPPCSTHLLRILIPGAYVCATMYTESQAAASCIKAVVHHLYLFQPLLLYATRAV